MEEKNIFIKNLKINYRIAGSGPAILLLHGWGSSSYSWIKVQEALSNEGYFVVCPDLPGFGKSDLPKFPYSLSDYQKIIVEFAKNVFSDSSSGLILLGHSFGGRISIKIAAERSLNIKKLILCNPAGIKVKPSVKSQIIILIASLGDLIFSIKPLKKLKHFARNFFYFFIKKRDYAKSKGVMKKTIKKILNEDLSSILDKIELETLLLWGEKDKIIPLKCSKIFNEKIKNSYLEVIPKVGHSPHLESPLILVKKIIYFLNKK